MWQARGSENKEKVAIRKKEIQRKFKEEMGLLVDIPKSGGSGTTNDGDTARRFFDNPSISSSITGIDENLIYRFSVILKTLNQNFAIDPTAFGNYAMDTAKQYVRLYPWYYMPASVHKILIHGADIISSCLLPIGMMSEEAQEHRNKHLKHYREHHTRKNSRINTNCDLFNRLLLSSDLLITSLRRKIIKKKKNIPKDVLNLLKAPEIPQSKEETGERESENENGSECDESEVDGSVDDESEGEENVWNYLKSKKVFGYSCYSIFFSLKKN